MNTNRNTKKKSLNLILIWLGAIEVVAMLTVTYLSIQHRIDVNKDRSRFVAADHKRYGAFDVTAERIGASPLRIAEEKICYRLEQKLWASELRCRMATAAYFTQEFSEQEVRRYFVVAAEAIGVEVVERSPNGEFLGAEGLPCHLEIYDGKQATNPSRFLPKEPAAKQTIVVACDAAAKANHYPFVESLN